MLWQCLLCTLSVFLVLPLCRPGKILPLVMIALSGKKPREDFPWLQLLLLLPQRFWPRGQNPRRQPRRSRVKLIDTLGNQSQFYSIGSAMWYWYFTQRTSFKSTSTAAHVILGGDRCSVNYFYYFESNNFFPKPKLPCLISVPRLQSVIFN